MFRHGSNWKVVESGYKYNPVDPYRLLIQVESAGNDDNPKLRDQDIYINGSQVLNSISPRSYRATQLRMEGGSWNYITSSGFDVYGSNTNASNMNIFLNSFQDRDLLVMNTFDEPSLRRWYFTGVLYYDFKAREHVNVAHRESYQLIAIKNIGVIYENRQPRFGTSIRTTLYL